MKVDFMGFSVMLRALAESEVELMLPKFNSAIVHRGTMGRYAQSLESEIEWHKRVSTDKSSCHWAIVPEDRDFPVGITGIHDMDRVSRSGVSGIIIWETDWWGKGVATRAHLGRTLWAADVENLALIRSSARVFNAASRKALQRVGYTEWGIEPCSHYRWGQWIDTAQLLWINPRNVEMVFPNGVPSMFEEGIEKAKLALTLAREVVQYL